MKTIETPRGTRFRQDNLSDPEWQARLLDAGVEPTEVDYAVTLKPGDDTEGLPNLAIVRLKTGAFGLARSWGGDGDFFTKPTLRELVSSLNQSEQWRLGWMVTSGD